MLTAAYNVFLTKLSAAVRNHYGENLVSLVVFGSVGRGTPRPDSDIDFLIVSRDLPRGRLKRMQDFSAVEAALAEEIRRLSRKGIETSLSPVMKTPGEVLRGSPLFLDMTEDAKILYDRDGFFARCLADLRERLLKLGAKRIRRGNAWYWVLKADYVPEEVFHL